MIVGRTVGSGPRLVAVVEPLDFERRGLQQLPGAAVRVTAGRDVAVRELDEVLEAAERGPVAGVDVLEEQEGAIGF